MIRRPLFSVRSKSKHGNKKIVSDVQIFDSKREYLRYSGLKLEELGGLISGLKRQVPFVLAPSVRLAGEPRLKSALKYTADFTYERDGVLIVEDAKSPHLRKETAYRIRKHLMKSVLNIDIVEV